MDKGKLKHDQVTEFRPGILSSEFKRLVGFFIFTVCARMFVSGSAAVDAASLLVVSYAVGRGMFKKSRLSYVGKGERTTEFWAILAVQAYILLEWYFTGIPGEFALKRIALCESGYQIARGIGKSYIPRDIKLPFGLS